MNEVLSSIPEALSYWWLAFPLVILYFLRDWWRIFIVDRYINSLDWVLLELKIPKENLKSIKAMEHVIAAIHGTYTYGLRPSEIWIEGKVEDWMSLEMVGFEDGVHFYIRTQKQYRRLVESAVFAQYPDAEIFEVEDYVGRIKNKPFDKKDVFGTDFMLSKKDCYPIRTYEYFEDTQEESRIDPIAVITEVMSQLKANETIWIQVLIQPTGEAWFGEAEEEIAALMGSKKEKSRSPLYDIAKDIGDVLTNLPTAPLIAPEFGGGGEEKKQTVEFKFRNPKEEEGMKAITRKMSKPSFNTIVRFVYIDDRDEFTAENVMSVLGAFRQYTDQTSNALRPNLKTLTKKSQVGKINKAKRLANRKKHMVLNYINREILRPVRFPFTGELRLKMNIMNTEEIASLFHMPTDFVKSKKIQAAQSKKGQAPMDLPTKSRE